MSLFWMLMSESTMVLSTPLSTSNPPTPNNTSTTIAITPHQPNAPFLSPLPLEGVISVTITITSTPPRPGLPVSHHHLLSWPSLSRMDPQGRFPYPLLGSINPGPSYHTPICHLPKTPISANSLSIQVSAPTGFRSYNRPWCKTCPIHHLANSCTSSCTNVTYPITTHADCKSMN